MLGGGSQAIPGREPKFKFLGILEALPRAHAEHNPGALRECRQDFGRPPVRQPAPPVLCSDRCPRGQQVVPAVLAQRLHGPEDQPITLPVPGPRQVWACRGWRR